MHRKLRRAGVEAELHVFEAMPHGGFGGDSPEDGEAAAGQRHFFGKHGLGEHGALAAVGEIQLAASGDNIWPPARTS